MNGILGNTSTIKAYAANDSLYAEGERGPECCHQKNKFCFWTVLLCSHIKAFFFCTSQKAGKAIRKKNVVQRVLWKYMPNNEQLQEGPSFRKCK